jgi:hypothetical protein
MLELLSALIRGAQLDEHGVLAIVHPHDRLATFRGNVLLTSLSEEEVRALFEAEGHMFGQQGIVVVNR